VIPEETLFGLLETCLSLSGRALAEVRSNGAAQAASTRLQEDYTAFIEQLRRERRHDTTLADESWQWIWSIRYEINPLQIYGRLAFINYNLIDLL
jgi:hypothetical protein